MTGHGDSQNGNKNSSRGNNGRSREARSAYRAPPCRSMCGPASVSRPMSARVRARAEKYQPFTLTPRQIRAPDVAARNPITLRRWWKTHKPGFALQALCAPLAEAGRDVEAFRRRATKPPPFTSKSEPPVYGATESESKQITFKSSHFRGELAFLKEPAPSKPISSFIMDTPAINPSLAASSLLAAYSFPPPGRLQFTTTNPSTRKYAFQQQYSSQPETQYNPFSGFEQPWPQQQHTSISASDMLVPPAFSFDPTPVLPSCKQPTHTTFTNSQQPQYAPTLEAALSWEQPKYSTSIIVQLVAQVGYTHALRAGGYILTESTPGYGGAAADLRCAGAGAGVVAFYGAGGCPERRQHHETVDWEARAYVGHRIHEDFREYAGAEARESPFDFEDTSSDCSSESSNEDDVALVSDSYSPPSSGRRNLYCPTPRLPSGFLEAIPKILWTLQNVRGSSEIQNSRRGTFTTFELDINILLNFSKTVELHIKAVSFGTSAGPDPGIQVFIYFGGKPSLELRHCSNPHIRCRSVSNVPPPRMAAGLSVSAIALSRLHIGL
ncbi:hypothetical protein DFH07DRAFT_777542 [Mycena maculata]|uniref:Uncharacterized protein n=1 Tax=Mycena maculata TaxID=230809 RepID=A0AAD7N2P3_9AGAR|nr:hypothetical protein DFH07DRAFT_777542 [Mycena maculata]